MPHGSFFFLGYAVKKQTRQRILAEFGQTAKWGPAALTISSQKTVWGNVYCFSLCFETFRELYYQM